jgi:WD40 repeat protein
MVWDVKTRARLQHLRGHASDVNRVAFTLDGERLATASDDRRVILWRLRDGQQIARTAPYRGKVFGLTVSPVTGEIAASTQEGEIALLDDRTGHTIRSMSSQGAEFSTTFSRRALVAHRGGGAHRAWYSMSARPAGFHLPRPSALVMATAISPTDALAPLEAGTTRSISGIWGRGRC